jgi:hypothetical protein
MKPTLPVVVPRLIFVQAHQLAEISQIIANYGAKPPAADI